MCYIVVTEWDKRVCDTLEEAKDVYMDWCNATEFVELLDSNGNTISQSW